MFPPKQFAITRYIFKTVACGGYDGNHQVHHPPLVVKGYILPGVEVAGNLADLFQQLAKKMIEQVGK